MRADRSPISVVVPTRDRVDLLVGCLDALRTSLRDTDQLIVADSDSRDHRVKLEAESRSADYLRCEIRGASIARNAGWRAAEHDIIAFVDDDIRVREGWADAVAGAFAAFPEAAFVTGSVVLPEGPRPERPVAIKSEDAPSWLDGSTTGVIGHSANLAVRRSALEHVRGFDDRLGAGGRFLAAEDLDLFDRLFAAGLRGRYEPAASATHVHWRRRPDVVRLEWGYGVGAGARLAKLIRTDTRRARRELKLHLWHAGARATWNLLRGKRFFLAGTKLIRTLGLFIGFVRCSLSSRLTPDDG